MMIEYTYPQKVIILPKTWQALVSLGGGDGSLGTRLLLSGNKPLYTSHRTLDEWMVLRKQYAEQHTLKITTAQGKTLMRWAEADGVLYRGVGNRSLYLDIILS